MLQFNMEKLVDDKPEPEKAKIDPKKWHEWYAWHPVKINGFWYWFRKVYRRKEEYFGKRGILTIWHYALDMFDVLRKIKEDPPPKDEVAELFKQAYQPPKGPTR